MRSTARPLAAVAAMVALLLAGPAGAAASAEANAPSPQASTISSPLMFRHWVTGKCLEVLYSSLAPQAPVGQYDCHGGPNQLWLYEPGGLLRNVHSGKCLEVYYGSPAENAHLVQFRCDGAAHQRWTVDWNTALIHNQWTGKCVAIPNSWANFAQAVQQVCNSNPGWGWWRW